MSGNHTQRYSNIFLGTVERQNLIGVSAFYLFVYGSFFLEGTLMIFGNGLLISVIFSYKALRRKELYIMAGLAMGDLLYGIGYFSAGIRRISLALESKHLWKVTPWSCMTSVQTTFFIAGSQIVGGMLVLVSMDRLLAVKWFAFYMKLGKRYAKTVMIVVYSYCILTVPGTALLSAFGTEDIPSIPAICISTQVGPGWYRIYQPTLQLVCGLLSVGIYVATWYFYMKQVEAMPEHVQNQQLDRQRKITRTVGITVICTFVLYVIPISVVQMVNALLSKQMASQISVICWLIANLNSIANIFILGVHNKDIRRVLHSWVKFQKPVFAGGHTLDPTAGTGPPGKAHTSHSNKNITTGQGNRGRMFD